MECRRVRELADSFLSGQLLVETNHEVIRHLEACGLCRDEIAARRALRERLRAAWSRAESLQPRPAFTAELSAVLRREALGVTRRRLLRTWGALAAGLTVAAAGGALYVRGARSRTALATLAAAAAGDHEHCALHFSLAEPPIPLADAGRRFGSPFGDMDGFTLPAPLDSARIVDRHSCVYDGHRFAHVVFDLDGTVISLLVTGEDAPDAIRLEPVAGARDVAALPAGPYLAFVVGDAAAPRLLDVAQTLEAALARQLS